MVSLGDKKAVLTDIAYSEDINGDMDFKIAGTKNGICAIQMDVKIDGIDLGILETTLSKAKEGKLSILEKIKGVISAPRKELSPLAPKVAVIHIDPAKIGEVIGSGGRVINKIIDQTGAAVDIDDDGSVTISGKDQETCQKALDWVEGITKEFKPGEIYEGEVKRIFPFGAMVEVFPGREGLVHISQLSAQRVNKVEDVVNLGQKVKVRVSETDDQGRLNLSMLFGEDAQKQFYPPQRNNFQNRDKFRRRR
jgi:polyribonucleotide nucleotidyltransferase